MADEIQVPAIEYYKGEPYKVPGKWWLGERTERDDYIRFRWSTGYLEMRMYDFEKLKKSQQDKLYNLTLGVGPKSKKSKSKKSPSVRV